MNIDKDGKFKWGKSDPSLEFPEIVPTEEPPKDTTYKIFADRKTQMEEVSDAADLIKSEFPRIYERIDACWCSNELDSYLEKLIIDHRGDRNGFPKDVLEALLILARTNLSELHKDGQVIDKYKNNPWITFSYK